MAQFMVQFKCSHWGYVEADSPLAGAKAGERAKQVRCPECEKGAKRRAPVENKEFKELEVKRGRTER